MATGNKHTPLSIPDPLCPGTVILADGDYPSTPYENEILTNARQVICCDGAADSFVARGGTPTAIVGDLDSVSTGVRQKFAAILHHDPDQETNDLTKAVAFCFREGCHTQGDIVILGATGKREDHTIGNISLLASYNNTGTRVRMVTSRGVIDHIACDTRFTGFPGQQVTILCLDPATHITTYDLRYPLHRANLRAWWMGTLNECTGDGFGIGTDGDTFIYRLF